MQTISQPSWSKEEIREGFFFSPPLRFVKAIEREHRRTLFRLSQLSVLFVFLGSRSSSPKMVALNPNSTLQPDVLQDAWACTRRAGGTVSAAVGVKVKFTASGLRRRIRPRVGRGAGSAGWPGGTGLVPRTKRPLQVSEVDWRPQTALTTPRTGTRRVRDATRRAWLVCLGSVGVPVPYLRTAPLPDTWTKALGLCIDLCKYLPMY